MARGIDRLYLARLLKRRSRGYVDERMAGRVGWTLDEMYTLMDILSWPYDRMHELFPKAAKPPRAHRRPT